MKKVLSVIGTRPEAIKMCPLLASLGRCREISSKLVLSGQHRELAESVLGEFRIKADYNLFAMRKQQSLFDLTERVGKGFCEILEHESPDLVLVHGDTTTAFAAALAAFYMKIPVGHVEAGLRTYDTSAPYPEEFNRRAIDVMSELCFAPTERARQNLLREGISEEKIFVTGNTGIDALYFSVGHEPFAENKNEKTRTVTVTLHRRETDFEVMREIMMTVRKTLDKYDDVRAVFPVHPSPRIRQLASEVFGETSNVYLCEPLPLIDFHRLIAKSYLIVSDSGGIQEEAAALGVPLLLAREVTERPEAEECGNMIVGSTSPKKIGSILEKLLTDRAFRDSLAKKSMIFGDGRASERITRIICEKINADFINNM